MNQCRASQAFPVLPQCPDHFCYCLLFQDNFQELKLLCKPTDVFYLCVQQFVPLASINSFCLSGIKPRLTFTTSFTAIIKYLRLGHYTFVSDRCIFSEAFLLLHFASTQSYIESFVTSQPMNVQTGNTQTARTSRL